MVGNSFSPDFPPTSWKGDTLTTGLHLPSLWGDPNQSQLLCYCSHMSRATGPLLPPPCPSPGACREELAGMGWHGAEGAKKSEGCSRGTIARRRHTKG